ncbi:TonB-dependent siderophore receptor [Pseudomonas sp. 5P_5.1_Bac1]|uniref:TonB-dependent siderophore receptor n=1 Tax=Pseudomonas sp. 5P_5.1_Bac1 TaxID=2971616 RepID=UPI0021C9BFD6|nr:TonB-dependent siderophore receptor [Pseudomonas sp. 5P_5.1_Bac1]MCU1725086.1 TonB-dependent siderophore receptor [Pseudomonas sp. 5P_5.1_Bac1]
MRHVTTGIRPLVVALRRATLLMGLLPALAWAEPVAFDIPAQSLGSALNQLAEQSGLQVIYNGELVQGLSSPAVRGSQEPEAALQRLLQGSGLIWHATGAGSVMLEKAAVQEDAVQLGATSVTGAVAGSVTEGSTSYATRGPTTTATRLNMTQRETPQSVTVVTRQRMDDQNMKDLDDVLQNTTGVIVIKNGGERSLYQARGQLVDSLQIDGVPTNVGNAYSMDAISKPATDIYDRVEVVRGATGLTEGAGTPSAAINLVRKRPTAEPQALVETSVGSWDNYRTLVDLSSALNEQGTLRGRTVISYNDANSYMDNVKKENQLFYGIVEMDLSASTMATLGFSYQKDRNSGYDWSALPTAKDGAFYPLSRSTNLTGKWNKLNKNNTTFFADIQHSFDNDWKLIVAANHIKAKSDFLGNYTWRVSGDRFSLNPRHFFYDDTQTSVDGYATGPFELLGRRHELVLGANVRKDDFDYHGGRDAGYGYQFDMNDLSGFNPPKPTGLNANMWKYNITQEQSGVYGAARFSLTDSTKFIVGSRVSWFKTENMTNTTGIPRNTEYAKNREITPYAGLVQELSDNLSAYASYTEIFKPQANLDASGSILDPMTGSNYELGLKGEFYDKRLNASVALFQADQTGRAEYLLPCNCYEPSEKVRNRGVELEVNGALTEEWNLSAGYTYVQSKYIGGEQKGEDYSSLAPRHLFKIATDYRLPGVLNKARVGGSVYAQSKITNREANYQIQQRGYALTSLHAIYELNEHLELQYNLDNVFDKKYIQTIGNDNYWNFYGEPRNFNVALRAKF